MISILVLLLPEGILILMGYLICNYTKLGRSFWDQVDKSVYYIFFPVLLFRSISSKSIDFSQNSGFLLGALCLCIVSVGLTFALPWIPGISSRIRPKQFAASAQIAFRFNSFIGLSLAESLKGDEGFWLMSILAAIAVPIYNVASVWPMANTNKLGLFKEITLNPLILGAVCGILYSLLKIPLPEFLDICSERLSSAAIPTGLLAAGAGMKVIALRTDKTLSFLLLFVKHILISILGFQIANIFELNNSEALILIVFASLPTATSSYILAAKMGYDGGYVAALVTLSTILSAFTLPFVLFILM